MSWLFRTILPVGTRSLLFGVHQIVWHPVTVALAWRAIYGVWPRWREWLAIIVHDWGYWGSPDMDGPTGARHPVRAAALIGRWLGPEVATLVLLHSRHYARELGREPSCLCWADKYSIAYEPAWWYLLRARLSGELPEYRQLAATAGVCPLEASDRAWFAAVQERLTLVAATRHAASVPYQDEPASPRGREELS